jgi:hypothetical protein
VAYDEEDNQGSQDNKYTGNDIFVFLGFLSDMLADFELGLICISLFTILAIANIVFAIKKHRKNLKKLIPIVVSLVLVVCFAFFIRILLIEFAHVSTTHKILMRTIDTVERYFENSGDFDLKGTVDGERIGKVLINRPDLDEDRINDYFNRKNRG